MTYSKLILLVFWLMLIVPALAQQPQPASSPLTIKGDGNNPGQVEGKLASNLMAREMPYRVVLPAGYSDAKNTATRYPVIYLLHGFSGHYNGWTDRAGAAINSANRRFIIVTPEGDNGFYTDSAAKPNDKYESYIVKELIPEIDKKFRTNALRSTRAIAGLSMGGFGAIKFGLKYPEMFSLAGSFSGAVAASSYRTADELPPGNIRNVILPIFGDAGTPTQKANDIYALVREASPEKIKTFPFLYVDCGTEDFLFKSNRDFVDILVEKKVPHEFRQLPGAHNWQFWNSQIQEFFEVADARLHP